AGGFQFRLLGAGGYAAPPVFHGSGGGGREHLWRTGHGRLRGAADGAVQSTLFRDPVRPVVRPVGGRAHLPGRAPDPASGRTPRLAGLLYPAGADRPARPGLALVEAPRHPQPGQHRRNGRLRLCRRICYGSRFQHLDNVMRVISANLNGIRSATSKGFLPWAAAQNADFICLQELKAQAANMTPEMLALPDSKGFFHYAEKKGYSGVGVYARHEPKDVIEGLGVPEIDAEGRYLELVYDKLALI